MAELSKDEIQADAILDAVTPPAAAESSFPEITKKKPTARKPTTKKTPASAVAKKTLAPEKAVTAAAVEPAPPIAPKVTPATSNELIKKAWNRINSWGLGISGKVILLLIVIGVFSQIVRRF